MISETDKAYAAGIIDGEGCICLHKSRKRKDGPASYSTTVSVAMCDSEPLMFLVDFFGGNVHSRHPPRDIKLKRRPHTRWEVTGNAARMFLESILPYLKNKRDQAIIAIEHQQRRSTEWGKRVGLDFKTYQEETYRHLRELKKPSYVCPDSVSVGSVVEVK